MDVATTLVHAKGGLPTVTEPALKLSEVNIDTAQNLVNRGVLYAGYIDAVKLHGKRQKNGLYLINERSRMSLYKMFEVNTADKRSPQAVPSDFNPTDKTQFRSCCDPPQED